MLRSAYYPCRRPIHGLRIRQDPRFSRLTGAVPRNYSGERLSIGSQGANVACAAGPFLSRVLGFSISSNARITQSSSLDELRSVRHPCSYNLRKGFLWTEQYPQVSCHLEQFRLSGQPPALTRRNSRLAESSRLPTRSLESIFLFAVPGFGHRPFRFSQSELRVVLRSARNPCQSHRDPARLPEDLTEPPSFTPARSGSKHYAFKLPDL